MSLSASATVTISHKCLSHLQHFRLAVVPIVFRIPCSANCPITFLANDTSQILRFLTLGYPDREEILENLERALPGFDFVTAFLRADQAAHAHND